MKSDGCKNKYFFYGLLLTFSMSLLSWPAFAGESDEPQEPHDLADCEVPMVFDEKLLKSVMKWIKEHGKVPSALELAQQSELSTRDILLKVRQFPGVATKTETDETALMNSFVRKLRTLYPAVFGDFHHDLLKEAGSFFKRHLRTPSETELGEVLGSATTRDLDLIYAWNPALLLAEGGDKATHEAAQVAFAREVYLARPQDAEVARNKVVRAFIKMARATQRIPLIDEVATELKISPSRRELFARQFFGEGLSFQSLEALKASAVEFSPRSFANVTDTDFFNQERVDHMLRAIRTSRRLIITTAVAGAPVNRPFLDALLKYAELRGATILVAPANYQTTGLDPILLNHPNIHILMNTVHLTPDLVFNNIRITGKQMDPLMGLDVRWPRGQSVIVGSPKMRMQVVPTKGNPIRPHALYSTGSVTDPAYGGKYYHNWRTDDLAAEDHVMGAVVVERLDPEAFFPELGELSGQYTVRHVEFIPEEAGFMDLNAYYTPTGVKPAQIKAVVPGDIHVGDTDDSILAQFSEHVLGFGPESIVLHDFLNGHSISHHDAKNTIGQSGKARNGKLDLGLELNQMNRALESLLMARPNANIVMVHSNHTDWLPRWLATGDHPRDALNAPIGNYLAYQMSNGRPPLQEAIENGVPGRDDRSFLVTPIPKALQRRVRFVDSGESYCVGSGEDTTELGLHGHAGANGGKGSLRSMRRAHGGVVYGHTHTIARDGRTVNIGTFTPPVLSYSKDGFSSWVRGLGIVGPHGEVQALMFQGNQWFATSDSLTVRGDRVILPRSVEAPGSMRESFFWPGYPYAEPNNLPQEPEATRVDAFTSENRDGSASSASASELPGSSVPPPAP